MQRHLRVVGEPLKEFVHQIDVELADQRALELDVVLESGPPGEIDHDARQRLVERYIGMPVTPNAFLVADATRHSLPQRDPDALARARGADLQAALRPNTESEN